MTIVSQNYNNLITNLINKHILEATSNIAINSYDDVFNYINIIQNFDSILTKTITLSIKAYLEELDYNYTISNERKRKYHIKDYRSRTILTIFGEITYSRSKGYSYKMLRKIIILALSINKILKTYFLLTLMIQK